MASNTFGGTVKLDGESEYRKALSNITAQLGVVATEMNKVTAEFGKNDRSMEGNAKKSDVLNSKLDAQKQKVDTLRGALEQTKEQYGETDTRTLRWQKSLNQAEADVIKTEKEISQLGKTTEESGNNAEKSSDGYTVFKNVIANLATDAIEGAINGIKNLGSAVMDLGKQAVSGFGEFEQLEGGVEKLFGEDVKATVVKNANNAFKTAGMSANEYMETVTGFSKSMIVSLNGDTKKAADLSDQALRDMSDNANTFGTDMQSIQNAYGGFAKGQFNMLDNLKLGYGGTKQEMERLLKDAEKLSGKKYDVSNFADITEAIHEIQVASNIAGTTEKEAMGTIEGSINAMKSSWSNLITGLATEGADFGQLVSNLFSSLVGDGNGEGGVINNVLKTVDRLVDGVFEALPIMLDGISEQLPAFLEKGSEIITKLVTGLTNNLPLIMESVMEVINMLLSTIVQNLPAILKMGIQVIVSLIQGIAQSLPTLIPTIIDAVLTMVDTLLDNIDLIIDAGIQLLMGLTEGLINALPQLIDRLPEIIDKIVMALADNLPKLVEAGLQLTIMLGVGLIKAIPQLISKIPQIVGSLLNGFATYYSHMGEIGMNIIKGIGDGFKRAKDYITNKIREVVNNIKNGFKKLLGIHSPSTLFRDEIGTYLAQGIGVGFTDEMKNVAKNMEKAVPTNFDITPNVTSGFRTTNNGVSNVSDEMGSIGGFTAIINNNSKYTSPAENTRLIRQQYELYKLKYGKVGA